MSKGRGKAKPRELLVAESETMRRVVDAVEELAAEDVPVLIEGEPGTGRELIARIIHKASARRHRSFIPVSAGAAPKEIFTDEIEGSSNSAFRMASGGTLLVKNLSELSRNSQRKLCRALRNQVGTTRDEDAFDVRVLGTADPDLESAVEAEGFNAALYDRLSRHRIYVPPLRERTTDIAPLAAQLIRRYARELGRKRMSISTRAYDRLVTYPWPGNVAELKAITRRLVVRASRGRIEAGDVDAILPMVAERVPLEQMSFEEMVRSKLSAFLRRVEGYPIEGLYDTVISRVEGPLLELVMEHTGGNQVKAAEILGLNRNTLRRKLSERKVSFRTKARAKREAGRRADKRRDAGSR